MQSVCGMYDDDLSIINQLNITNQIYAIYVDDHVKLGGYDEEATREPITWLPAYKGTKVQIKSFTLGDTQLMDNKVVIFDPFFDGIHMPPADFLTFSK